MSIFALLKQSSNNLKFTIMAHNLEFRNGDYSYVERGNKERQVLAWHKLGNVFSEDRALFVNEALELSRANYEVDLAPMVALTPELIESMSNDKMINAGELLKLIVPNKKATVRTDNNNTLGVVSDKYGIVQNKDAFQFIDTMCSGMKAERQDTPVIETAGVLGNGERVFVTAKFPEKIRLDNKGNDIVEMYMVFTTSHDGTGAVNCMVTPVRVVCNNTLNYVMKHNSGKLSLRHTSQIMSRLDLTNEENIRFAFKALNLYDVYSKSLKESFDHLKQIKLSENELDRILAEVLLTDDNLKVYNTTKSIYSDGISTRNRNIFVSAKDCIESGVGQEIGERGTGLWLINGITSYYQNAVANKDNEIKFESQLNGNIQRKLQKTYNLVTAL